MNQYRLFIVYTLAIACGLIILFLPYIVSSQKKDVDQNTLNILTYSSFIKPWGPGPQIAQLFKEKTGTTIKWINAGNAGLILERLKFKSTDDQPDAIIGLDQFSILEARKVMKWQDVHGLQDSVVQKILPKGSTFHDFLAYDWGPLAFIYRKDEIDPPRSLDDLLSERFKNSIILQDPRMSSPGLQFLFWVLHHKGEQGAYDYLNRVKSSIKIMAPSWSSSYSIFQVEKPSLVFSYVTSTYYHLLEEKNDNYRAATFNHPHPVQVEYAGIPVNCVNCEKANEFLNFLLETDVQKILMYKNYMFPVDGKALEGSQFKIPQGIKFFDPVENWSLIRKKKELVDKWKKVFY